MGDSNLIPAGLLARARQMRYDPAPAEGVLWQLLRNRQLGGFKFRRQTPMPPFIADFYCAEVDLIIELDGDSHSETELYDASRTKRLTRGGLHVIRFLNVDVYSNIDAVLEEILCECELRSNSKSPSPQPSPGVPGEGAKAPLRPPEVDPPVPSPGTPGEG
jgi:very-short-patch-repair endonuclease